MKILTKHTKRVLPIIKMLSSPEIKKKKKYLIPLQETYIGTRVENISESTFIVE